MARRNNASVIGDGSAVRIAESVKREENESEDHAAFQRAGSVKMLHDSAVVDFICHKENHWGNPQFPIFDHLTNFPVNMATTVAQTCNLVPFY